MPIPAFVYIGPLFAAFIYVLAAIMLKRCMHQGVGAMRAIWISNWIQAAIFLPLFCMAQGPIFQPAIFKAFIVSFCVFIGECFVIAAIKTAAVSVQSPVMGIKVIFVAVLCVLLGSGEMTPTWWLSAGLSSLAVFSLGLSGFRKEPGILKGILLAILASACFALEDALLQKWSHDYDPYAFVGVMGIGLALYAILLLPFMRDNFPLVLISAKRWLIGGSLLMAAQGVLYSLPISLYGHAPIVNICYSSRGLWSVLCAWTIGRFMGSVEHQAGKIAFYERLFGAGLICVAIALILG